MHITPIMKRITLALLVLATAATTRAQVAKWLIPPVYKNIDIASDVDVIIADSAKAHILWSFNGRRLATVTDDFYPYTSGHAVTTKPGTAVITNIYDGYGRATAVDGFQLGWGHPLYADGWLLVHDGQYYAFMDGDGNVSPRRLARAYPFNSGFAAVHTFVNLAKRKSPYYQLLDTDLNPVVLRWEGKAINVEDFDFISSVNDEGVGIVVAHRKVYFFDAATKSLSPVFATEGETNLKNQAKLDGDLNQCLIATSDSTMMLQAKCARGGRVEIVLSGFMAPTEIIRNGESHTYPARTPQPRRFTAMLKKHLGDNGKLGLLWDTDEMLPPQFSKVMLCMADKAIVQLDGKWGMLRVFCETHFDLSVNHNDPLPFRHQKLQTTLRVGMPPYIDPATASVEIDPSTGCNVDKLTKQSNTTTDGNIIQYACMLSIPDGITDKPAPISFPARVYYDGLVSNVIPINAQAWLYNFYNVDTDEKAGSSRDGSLQLTFDINPTLLPDEALFPTTFDLDTGGLPYDIEKVSETRYKCKLSNLQTGTNHIYALVTEEGCPTHKYHFEIEYTKPATHSGGNGKVTIRKVPHLDI